jgi:hypothetical protein
MGDFQITCIRNDDRQVITHVGINGRIYSIQQILIAMENRDTFFTNKNGYRATVYRKQHFLTDVWFLTTEPDKTDINNLDFLPQCPSYYSYA